MGPTHPAQWGRDSPTACVTGSALVPEMPIGRDAGLLPGATGTCSSLLDFMQELGQQQG